MTLSNEQEIHTTVEAYQGGKESWVKVISPLAPHGLYLKLSTGRGAIRSEYVYRYRALVGQYQRKLRLGSTHDLTFAEALAEHYRLSKLVNEGKDPAGDKHKEKVLAVATAGDAVTIAELAEQYLEHKAKLPSTWRENSFLAVAGLWC